MDDDHVSHTGTAWVATDQNSWYLGYACLKFDEIWATEKTRRSLRNRPSHGRTSRSMRNVSEALMYLFSDAYSFRGWKQIHIIPHPAIRSESGRVVAAWTYVATSAEARPHGHGRCSEKRVAACGWRSAAGHEVGL